MKLTTETYRQGMEILANHYLDWKFDFTNLDMVSSWCTTLSDLISEQDFIAAVNCYVHTKVKGPTSPVELQQTYYENIPQLSPMEALNTLRGILTLFQFDDTDARVVEALTSMEINKALYLTYCNIAHLGYKGCRLYPNSALNDKFEDNYTCTWFITEYKRIQLKLLRDACVTQINALPSGSETLMIGGSFDV